MPLSGKERLRRYLLSRKGQIVTTQQLVAESGLVSAARRVRELRLDEGWPIQSRHDDPTLAQNEYRLTGDPPEIPPRPARHISGRVRAEVLTRDGSTCQLCGAGPGDPDNGRRVRLEPDHIEPDGPAEPGNLRTLCNRCNQGASNIAAAPESLRRLKALIRRARRADILAVRDWLNERYGEGADD